MAYTYRGIGEGQFTRFVNEGGVAGRTSPLLGTFAEFDAACRARNTDELLPLAWLRSENRMAIDISDGLLAAHNAAGIKDVGQERALPTDYDAQGVLRASNGVRVPLAPANEGSAPYCVFASWGDFYWTLAGNINWVIAQGGGDLNRGAWYYTLGTPGLAHADAGEKHAKVKYYEQFISELQGGAGVADTNVYGSDIIDYLRSLIGQRYSTVETDPRNGVHPWAYFCESLAERAPEHFGLTQVPRGSATLKGYALRDQGLLHTSGEPEHCAWVVFGPLFDGTDGDGDGIGDGHIGFWDKDRGMLLGTVTNGRGIDYTPGWGMNTYGVLGWARIPGVAGEYRPAAEQPTQPSDNYVPDGNPFNAGRPFTNRLGYGGAIRDFVLAVPEDRRMDIFGWATSNEYDGYVCNPQGDGTFAIKKAILQDTQRQRIVHNEDGTRVPLRIEVSGTADDPAVAACVNANKVARR